MRKKEFIIALMISMFIFSLIAWHFNKYISGKADLDLTLPAILFLLSFMLPNKYLNEEISWKIMKSKEGENNGRTK